MDYIEREAAITMLCQNMNETSHDYAAGISVAVDLIDNFPAADVRPVSEIEKIIEILQEQADIYNARAKELLVLEDGQVSQYTWAVSLRETYRHIIKTLDDLIS